MNKEKLDFKLESLGNSIGGNLQSRLDTRAGLLYFLIKRFERVVVNLF